MVVRLAVALVVFLSPIVTHAEQPSAQAAAPTFAKNIAPILYKNCASEQMVRTFAVRHEPYLRHRAIISS